MLIETQIRIPIKIQTKPKMITKDRIHPKMIPLILHLLIILPNASVASAVPQRPQLNWSHFKPKYAGKLEGDAEAHLLRMKNWMDMHDFQDQVKVQRFCLTLVGEARLWLESLRPINTDWEDLQHMFGSNTLR